LKRSLHISTHKLLPYKAPPRKRLPRLVLTLCLWGLLLPALQAQVLSNLGRFEANFNRACSPFTITVQKLEAASASYKYDDSVSDPTGGFVPDTFFTYTTPGTYQLIQLLDARTDTLTVEVFDPNPAPIRISNCGNNSVFVDMGSNTFDRYTIDFGDSEPPVSTTGNTSYTYAAPGNYTIEIQGLYDNALNNCNSYTETVEVLATLQSSNITSMQLEANGTGTITFVPTPNVLYLLQRAQDSPVAFATVDTLESSTATLQAPDLLTTPYCYRIMAFDACTNTRIYSDTLCTSVLTVTPRSGSNLVEWQNASPFNSEYLLSRDGSPIDDGANRNQASLEDTDITCGLEYCYRLEVRRPGSGVSVSAERCAQVATSGSLAAVPIVNTRLEDNQLLITWEPPANTLPGQYRIFQLDLQGDTTLDRTLGTTEVAFDRLNATDFPFTFYISYLDGCDSEGPVTPPITALQLVRLANANDDALELIWNRYNGYSSGIERYLLDQLDSEGNLLGSIDLGTDTLYAPLLPDFSRQVQYFRVQAVSADAPARTSFSNILEVVYPARINLPEAFTPNDDGLNDVFAPNVRFVAQFEMVITNRWEQTMYSSTDPTEGWDGTLNGKKVPEGLYTYRVRITDTVGRQRNVYGQVMLLDR